MSGNEQQSQALCDALALACQVHRGQLDLAGKPYILHVMRVVLACEGDDARVVAALHDAVEDARNHFICEADAWRAVAKFGVEVTAAVRAISKYRGERYTDYVARVAANPLAAAVKRADLIDNLREDWQPVGELRERYRRALARLSQ